MIRVGYAIEGQSWLGGINYFRNLFSALALLPNRKLHPVVFVGRQMSEQILGNFHNAEIVQTSLLDGSTFGAWLRRQMNKISDERDPLLGLLMARHQIDVLSHSGPLWSTKPIKTIGWIPDFQHVRLPEFFSEQERSWRDAAFHRMVRYCDCILLSSEAAERDLASFAPAATGKSRVLRFVPEVDAANGLVPLRTLNEKYGIDTPYFYMPNQFWIHKNHRLVIDALAALKAKGVRATLLMTGSTEDYRHPGHYADLVARVERNGLTDSFRVLGLVPYGDLLSLMHHCLAVINPSLFEGWSSSVEEAKALGKVILLSNLPVHMEQNPRKGIFFDPLDADDLAEKMLGVMRNTKAHGPIGNGPVYSETYKSDRLNFAAKYQEIVLDLAQ